MRLHVRLAYSCLAAVALLPGCKQDRDGSGSGSEEGRAFAVPDTASDAGAQVARRIVKAATLEEAISATREALTRGGLTISNLEGTTQGPLGPPSPFFVLPPEAVLLAHEARRHATTSRLTLDQFAAMLADLGWPFQGQEMPGVQLMQVIAGWVRGARSAPNDSLNFTPLFLADMGRRQVPQVDLASDSTDPASVRLGLLEMQLISAALTRGLGQPARTSSVDGVRIFHASYGAPASGAPCEDTKEWFGETVPGGLTAAFGGWGVGQALEQALESAGISKASVGIITKAMDAVAAGMKVVKLGALYGSVTIKVDHGYSEPVHRPGPREEKFATVKATAGIDPAEFKEYQESLKSSELSKGLRDCLEVLGLPTWSDISEAQADVDHWRIKWMLGKGAPKHALHTDNPRQNQWLAAGHRIMAMKRSGPNSSEATYNFMLTPELNPGHPGGRLRGEVEVIAELNTSKPPGVGTITDAMMGAMGLVKALADVGAGWFQDMVTAKTYIMVPVEYHQRGVELLIEDEGQAIVTFGDKGKSIISMTSSERYRHVYAGTIRLGEDSLWHGDLLVTANGDYRAGDDKAIRALAAKYGNVEGLSLEQLFTAFAEQLKFLSDIPTCTGSYTGAQNFHVEGSFKTGDKGQDQVELAFIAAGPPEYYYDTAGCPWITGENQEGYKVIPIHLSRDEETAIVIDAPKVGEQRVYPKHSNVRGLGHFSTLITVGADFATE
jgi:hypothetical protein